jgi:2-keto-4-pentenoate hydratase/2-oxohepta-3-ene-1,7-dioic acid hydratase in catechol pathway
VAHDVSARDLQLRKNGGQWLLGKAMDGFAPLGPAIVTPDEVGDVHNLRLRTIVNGEVMQDSSTSQLVHRVPNLIAYISRFMTLRPGDLILTGCVCGAGRGGAPAISWLALEACQRKMVCHVKPQERLRSAHPFGVALCLVFAACRPLV